MSVKAYSNGKKVNVGDIVAGFDVEQDSYIAGTVAAVQNGDHPGRVIVAAAAIGQAIVFVPIDPANIHLVEDLVTVLADQEADGT